MRRPGPLPRELLERDLDLEQALGLRSEPIES